MFQGNLTSAAQCSLGALTPLLGYQQTSANGTPNPQRFDSFLPNTLFLHQNYITAGFPLFFQPFGYPQAKNFVYAYAQQANLTIERDLGGGFALNVGYNFNGGRHLNRPINASAVRGDLLVANWQAAYSDPTSYAITGGPLGVGSGPTAQGFAPCGVNPSGVPWVSAALTNLFRPSGINASIANALIGAGVPQCVALVPAVMQYLQASGYSTAGFNTACNPLSGTVAGCVPFGDMDANYSNGSSVYNGLTANLRKRFSNHYEFLASYTWSHAIDDSTDLQSTTHPAGQLLPWSRSFQFHLRPAPPLRLQRRLPVGQTQRQRLRPQALQRLDVRPPDRIQFRAALQHPHRLGRQPAVVFPNRAAQHLRNHCLHAGGKPGNTLEILPHRYFPGALLSSFHSRRISCTPTSPCWDSTATSAATRAPLLDCLQRPAHRQESLLRRAHQHGSHRRHVQHRQRVQRGGREPANELRRSGHRRLRPAPVPVRVEIELVNQILELCAGCFCARERTDKSYS